MLYFRGLINLKSSTMKKLLFLLIILGITIQVSAKLKEKDLIGKWKYSVVTDQGTMSGVFNFATTDGKLSGKVVTDDGYTLPFTKIEIKDKNTLYLELDTDNDTIKLNLSVEDNKFKGTGTSYQGDAPITGEKVE